MSRIREALDEARDLYYRDERQQALAICERILDTVPNEPAAMYLKGMIVFHEGRTEEAIRLMRKAIQRNPASAAYHTQLGRVYAALEQWDEAAASFRRALRLKKDDVDALVGLGCTLVKRDEREAAIENFRAAIAIDPTHSVAYSELAKTLMAAGRSDEAVAAFRQVLSLVPDSADAHYNFGFCLQAMGEAEAAIAAYEQAITINPAHAKTRETLATLHLARAMVWLREGRFEDGWREFEWRWKINDYGRLSGGFAGAMWDGTTLGGGTILLHSEQGLGDAIQFVRYIPMVVARGARVLLGCHRPLARLFGRIENVDRVLVWGDEDFPATAARAPLMSLPRIFGTTLATIPAPVPYLTPAPEDVALWRARLAEYSGRRIGLVWAGNPQHAFESMRSISIEHLRGLAEVADATFFSLQFGPAAPAFATPAGGQFVDLSTELGDFLNTAAIMANLDLIISIDTSAAHLAGALGRPVWTLLGHVADWRWLKDREDSPWYPTMRLFRQSTPGDWSGVIARVKTELSRLPPR